MSVVRAGGFALAVVLLGTAALLGPTTVPGTGTPDSISRVSTDGAGGQVPYGVAGGGELSVGGEYATFQPTTTNNGPAETWVKNLATGEVTIASRARQDVPGKFGSGAGQLSADGHVVAFTIDADRFTPEATTAVRGAAKAVVVRNLRTGAVTEIATTLPGDPPAGAWLGDLSGDGDVVVFGSNSSLDAVRPVPTGRSYVYAHDLRTGTTTLVSVSPRGEPAGFHSSDAVLSADGSTLSFRATDEAEEDGGYFVKDLRTGALTSLPDAVGLHSPHGAWVGQPSLSADGGRIAFGVGFDEDAVAPAERGPLLDVSGVYVANLRSGLRAGKVLHKITPHAGGRSLASDPVLSADGRHLAYTLARKAAGNGSFAVVRDLRTGTVTRLTGTSAEQRSTRAPYSSPTSISADGARVLVESEARNLVPRDTNDRTDLFVAEVTRRDLDIEARGPGYGNAPTSREAGA